VAPPVGYGRGLYDGGMRHEAMLEGARVKLRGDIIGFGRLLGGIAKRLTFDGRTTNVCVSYVDDSSCAFFFCIA